jgi:hypothetical protein
MTDGTVEPSEPHERDQDGRPVGASGSLRPTPLLPDVAAVAADQAWRALDHPDAAARLAAYYDVDGDYAGRTFVEALDSPGGMLHDQFTPADLFAVSLLQVDIAPRAARVFLDPGSAHNELLRLLSNVPPDEDLSLAGPQVLEAMAAFYVQVKATLGRDPWVTASKICARKRPRLFPVRDKRVRLLLDLYRHQDYTIDWQVFGHLTGQPAVIDRLADLAAEAARLSPTVRLDPYPLRHLDVLLWMDARDRGIGGARR